MKDCKPKLSYYRALSVPRFSGQAVKHEKSDESFQFGNIRTVYINHHQVED
jgi:hypothetical protein